MIITRTKQILYSTLAILVGLCLSLVVHHTLTYLFAIIAGFKPILNLKGVVNLPVHYNSWTFERVILVHGIPSVLCISGAYVLIQLKRYAFTNYPSIRLVLFWFAFLFVCFAFVCLFDFLFLLFVCLFFFFLFFFLFLLFMFCLYVFCLWMLF